MVRKTTRRPANSGSYQYYNDVRKESRCRKNYVKHISLG